MSSANMAFSTSSDSNKHTKKKTKKSTHFTMGILSSVIIGIKRFFFSMKDIMHRASAAAHLQMSGVSSGGSAIKRGWDNVKDSV